MRAIILSLHLTELLQYNNENKLQGIKQDLERWLKQLDQDGITLTPAEIDTYFGDTYKEAFAKAGDAIVSMMIQVGKELVLEGVVRFGVPYLFAAFKSGWKLVKGARGEIHFVDAAGNHVSRQALNELAEKIGCFIAGTLISTEAGLRPIEDIRPKDRVWAFDHQEMKWELCNVEETFVRQYCGDFISIEVNNETVIATGEHPFWVLEGLDLTQRSRNDLAHVYTGKEKTPGRWVSVKTLCVGDTLLLQGQKSGRVKRVESKTDRVTVYNFKVAKLESYAVGVSGILVHNSSAAIWPVSGQNIKSVLSKGSFVEKIAEARELFRQAKQIDPRFIAQEARSVKGDFVFIGGGFDPKLKNVLIIRKDGSVYRMTLDPRNIKVIEGGGTQIFDVDLSCAELLVK